MPDKPISKKSLYIVCGVAVTVAMIIVKVTATVINKTVAILLEG